MEQEQPINSKDIKKLDEIQELIEESELKIQEVISLNALNVRQPDETNILLENLDRMIEISKSIENLGIKTMAEEYIKIYDNTFHEKMKQI
ncbi:hypothetical protein ACQKIY_25225 [Bacillus mycoides]|uniref:hypothetical protein n=1 Tax=Bacillus mycoides TaxID=1405 RepID=UPI003CFD6E7A